MLVELRGRGAFLVLGLIFLGFSLVGAMRSQRRCTREVTATGVIFWVDGMENNTMIVHLDQGPAMARTIPVRMAWWTLPGAYRNGDEVRILYDPRADYTNPLRWRRARIATFAQLWLSPILGSAAGVLCILLYLLAARSRNGAFLSIRVVPEND